MTQDVAEYPPPIVITLCLTLVSFFVVVYVPRLRLRERGVATFRAHWGDPETVVEAKRIFFEKLWRIRSCDAQRRRIGVLRIIELGCGAGNNVQFYPTYTRLIAVESNEYFEPYLRKKVSDAGIRLEQFLNTAFLWTLEDALADVVVATEEFLADFETLEHAKRLLVPTGRFFYMIQTCHNDWRLWFQVLIRKILFADPPEDLRNVVEQSGCFEIVSQCELYSVHRYLKYIYYGPMLAGIART